MREWTFHLINFILNKIIFNERFRFLQKYMGGVDETYLEIKPATEKLLQDNEIYFIVIKPQLNLIIKVRQWISDCLLR